MRLSQLWTSPKQSKPREFRVPDGHRVYAIGDIHGCHGLLMALLKRISQDVAAKPAAHVTLIYLGDYIDRGPKSADVITVVASRPKWAQDVVCLKGNHEEMLERFLAEPSYGAAWRQFGGPATLVSYGVDVKSFVLGRDLEHTARDFARALPAQHDHFIKQLPYSHVIGDFFFCHAGVRPGVALMQQQPADLSWIRHEFLSSDEDFGLMVVHGHSPVEEPEVWPNRINVDTGAYATGVLSCLVIEGSRLDFISVGADGR